MRGTLIDSDLAPHPTAWLFFLLLGVLMAGVGCQSQAPGPPPEPERVVLQLKWKHQFQFAGYYAAQQKGFYRDAGLDVQILESPDDAEPASVVLQGQADFGIASSDLVLLRNQGYPVVALAAIYQHSPLVFLALSKSGVNSIHGLAQKRVMIEPHSAELLAYLKYESISAADMTILTHTFDISALLEGNVQAISAYSTDEPFLLQQARLNYLTFSPRASGIDFYGDTLFTTEEQIQKHPQRVRAFLDASLKGWQYALDHPEEMVDLIYTQYSQRHSREHLIFEAEKTRQLILPEVVEIGYMNPGRWEHIANTYSEMKMAPANISLKGFLYERNPAADLTWLYLSLLGAVGVVGIVSILAGRFYQLNTLIRREMSEKEKITANLRMLEKRYRILVENAPFAILITRLHDGLFLYINLKAAQKLDIAPEYAIGKSVCEHYVNLQDRDALLAALVRQGYVQSFEILFKSAAGVEFWANISATLIQFGEEQAIFVALVDVTEQKELAKRLETMAMTDELTGLFNRRYFTQRGEEEFQQARRYQLPFSLMMLDLDRFKSVNDIYGHDAGDYVLKQFAVLMRHSLREVDILGRLGGEEFGVLLPNTDGDHTLILAERLRQTIEAHSFEIRGKSLGMTTSIGVATYHEDSASLDELLIQADSALYRAKNQGRNRVMS